MAGKSLGTLTLDLIAKVGGFVAGMDRAERSSDQWRRKVEANMKTAGLAVAGMVGIAASASVAMAGVGISLLKTTSEQVIETDRWAKSLKMSTQELMAWQFAAEKAGLSGDNIADIFKDINDKVGDAVLNNSGEAAQALDTLGLSAKKLAEQSPDKQLLAISSALEKIPTQAGKTMILESLGNDLSKMLPLFENNNEKLRNFIQLSKDFGVAPPQEDIDNLVKVNQFFQDLETQAKGLKIEIASGLAKVDLSPLQDGLDDMKKVFTDPAVLDGLTKLVGGVAQLVGWMGKMGSETGTFLNQLSEISARFDAGGWYQFEQNKKLEGMANLLLGDVKSITTPTKEKNLISDYTLGTGESNQKQKPDTSSQKLDNAYKSVESAYLQQIALVDKLTGKTRDATEVQKLLFDITSGKLTGINKEQQAHLEGLAAEIDKYKVMERYRDLQKDLLTPEQQLLKTTRERVKLLNEARGLGITNPEEYQKAAEAISKNSFQDAPKFEGLDPMFGGQSGELRKVDESQKELNKWYDNQLSILNENRKNQAELNEQWDARELEIKKKYHDEQNKLNESRNQLMLSSASEGLGSVVDITRAAFGEQSGIYKAAFITQKAAAVAQAAIAIQQGIAMAAANPFPLNLAAMAAVAASTAGLVSNIQSIGMVGMAHDGIDAVPETGTWLLQKGERVTTAATSARLDATLERVSQQSTSGQMPNIELHTQVNGDPDARTLRMLEDTQKAAVKQALKESAYQIASGRGEVGKAVGAGWNIKRKTG
ncbi:TPA: phage tail tape measure protein [Raoultella terrigena]